MLASSCSTWGPSETCTFREGLELQPQAERMTSRGSEGPLEHLLGHWSMGTQHRYTEGGSPGPQAYHSAHLHLQVILIISGNLSFLNWLTIVPSLACFDDAALGFLFPSGPQGLKNQVLEMQREETQGVQPKPRYGR